MSTFKNTDIRRQAAKRKEENSNLCARRCGWTGKLSKPMKKTQPQDQDQAQQTGPFTLKQREMIAALISDAKQSAADALESYSTLDSRIEHDMLPKLAKQEGVMPLVTKVQQLKKRVYDLESEALVAREERDSAQEDLEDQGFDVQRNGDLSINYNAPKRVEQPLTEEKKKAKQKRDVELNKYDLAIARVWAVETAAEAKKIVEEVLNS